MQKFLDEVTTEIRLRANRSPTSSRKADFVRAGKPIPHKNIAGQAAKSGEIFGQRTVKLKSITEVKSGSNSTASVVQSIGCGPVKQRRNPEFDYC